MSDYFIGEIRLFAFNWAPSGWALCQGQTLPLQQNNALYSLVGTRYGGDGKTNFMLPDFRGRTGYGSYGPNTGPYVVGNTAGAETVAITVATMPAHTHGAAAATGSSPSAINIAKIPALYAQEFDKVNIYATPSGTALQALNPATVTTTGGGQPHQNMQPFVVLNFCIATTGLYPPRQ